MSKNNQKERVFSMYVSEIVTSIGKTRYMLVNDDGFPVLPVLQYLKFKDQIGLARNTLRLYCFQLKLYFEFLEEKNLLFNEVKIATIAEFVTWLYCDKKVIPLFPIAAKRCARSINIAITVVLNFYSYLAINDQYENNISQKLTKQILGSQRGFKNMLYHISIDSIFPAKLLKIKEPRRKIKIIAKNEVELLIQAANNLRDKFLIYLLWESSMRIGEALSLWLEDFDAYNESITICNRGELENHAEIKTVCSERKLDISVDLINMYFKYLAMYHLDNVDTNHVFIKLSGKNKGCPLEYHDVAALFKRLRAKTGVHVTPHILRHTSLTALQKAGFRDEVLMKRAGHAHIQTTLQTYIHISDDDMRNEWNSVQGKMKLVALGGNL